MKKQAKLFLYELFHMLDYARGKDNKFYRLLKIAAKDTEGLGPEFQPIAKMYRRWAKEWLKAHEELDKL